MVTTDPDRFDLLPDANADPETFDREMGLFLDYPRDAIAQFLDSESTTIKLVKRQVRRGPLEPKEAAYVQFVPWVRSPSQENLERQIAEGKRIARRLLDINARCGTRHIAECVAIRYHTKRRRFGASRGETGGWFGWLSTLRDGSIVPEIGIWGNTRT
ncbi:MAG: hypothetical protein ABEH78_01160 [Haloferacaceae archaeon]